MHTYDVTLNARHKGAIGCNHLITTTLESARDDLHKLSLDDLRNTPEFLSLYERYDHIHGAVFRLRETFSEKVV